MACWFQTTLDPTIAKKYIHLLYLEHIIKNSITAKYLMYRYLGNHVLGDLQFGFVSGRGTDMAASLANDVFPYCTKRGSPVYTCSLDTEGAFDAVPHCVLCMYTYQLRPIFAGE